MSAKSNNKDSRRLTRDILGIFHLCMAILLSIAIYASKQSMGGLGNVLRTLSHGLFGTLAYVLPVVFLAWSLLYLFEKQIDTSRARILSIFVILLFIAALFSIFTLTFEELKIITTDLESPPQAGFRSIAALWKQGINPEISLVDNKLSGGLLGGIIGQSLAYLAGVPGAAVILIAMSIAVIVYAFSWSPSRYLTNLQEKNNERRERKALQKEENKVLSENGTETAKENTRRSFPQWIMSWNKTDDGPVSKEQTADNIKSEVETENSLFGQAVFTSKNSQNDDNEESNDFLRPPKTLRINGHKYTAVPSNEDPFIFPQEDSDEFDEKEIDYNSRPNIKENNNYNREESETKSQIRPAVIAKKEGSIEDDIISERGNWEDRSASKTEELASSKKNDKKKNKKKREQIDIFSEYKSPPLKLLRVDKALQKSSSEIHDIQTQGKKLEKTLESFGIDSKIVNYTTGPTITRYELVPGPGVKVSRITNLADDIALSLAATSVRIEAPIPGKSAIGIEIPNSKTSPVFLRGLLEDEKYREAEGDLLTPLGRNAGGGVILCDIAKMPHILIAGATGSGKSVCINSILISLLYRYSPEELRLLMIDPKIVELNIYNDIPHLLQPVVTKADKAYGVLNWAVEEMERRYELFADNLVRDITAYNLMVDKKLAEEMEMGTSPSEDSEEKDKDDEEKLERLPFILIVIDELADLMVSTAHQVEDAISRLMAKARAAGIHVIIATQRPSVDVVTGVIKANIPSRIAFAVTSNVDSRTILDTGGAEKLLGKGDMLYYPQSAAKPIRGQGAFVSDLEVERVLQYIKDYYPSDYDETVAVALENPDGTDDISPITGEEEDELLLPAIGVLLENGYASVSLLQRKLNVGYPRAARMIDRLNELGYVGPFEGSKPRELLISQETYEQLLEQSEEGNHD